MNEIVLEKGVQGAQVERKFRIFILPIKIKGKKIVEILGGENL